MQTSSLTPGTTITALLLLLALLVPVSLNASQTREEAEAHQDAHETATHETAITTAAHQPDHGADRDRLGRELPLWTCIPFAGILLSIAIFPMVAPGFWHRHYPKISFAWALTLAVPFLIIYHGDAFYHLLHIILADYVPFIILLWGLFTASGGIYLKGNLVGKPVVNLGFLVIGTVLASWMGTTGAAMLLIRPLIRANRGRRYKVHTVVFFIFLVANIGGSLTPLGDPPLFLGFLHGVPFFWTFAILPHMLMTSAILLALYFVVDSIVYAREDHEDEEADPQPREPIRIYGAFNFLLLLGIMGSVLMSGSVHLGDYQVGGVHMTVESTLRDLIIVLIGLISWWTTKREYRDANGFTWFPIKEVAYLFAGIFITIVTPLLILKAGTEGSASFIIEAVNEPFHYFWITGSLSSFLDNAPTYLTFFNLALGKLAIAPNLVTDILTGAVEHAAASAFVTNLTAISAGAVFFGAITYIGNAPNFMVRSISEESRIKMPSFFGYMLWSVGILVPIFLLVTLVFF
jgi:Na+/H+ antiporter NhaD/arsenite permease-like protein